jgi:hypothetical protein
MPELKFVLAGNQSDVAAAALVSALGPDGDEARRQTVTEMPDADRKVVDPISLAALILSIPSAVLAVIDIADRLTKRRKAQAVIDAAKKAKAEQQVDIYMLTSDQTPQSVANLMPDQLLDLVAKLQTPPR